MQSALYQKTSESQGDPLLQVVSSHWPLQTKNLPENPPLMKAYCKVRFQTYEEPFESNS